MDTVVKVIQWKSSKDFVEHTFSLYKDDTILMTLTKILGFLQITSETIVPYIWTNKTPLRFDILKNPWNGYAVNPYESKLDDKPPVPDVRFFSDRILDYTELHFTTYSDLSKVATKNTLRYYFPNEKDRFDPASITSAIYQHNLLQELQKIPEAAQKAMTVRSTSSYSRAFYNASLPPANYRQWFEQLPATTLIPFIQLYEDINHIYYKVYKEHTIPPNYFTDWTQLDKMKNQHSLIFYSFLKGQSYGKFFFDHDTNTLQISYYLDMSDAISFNKIHKHLKDILDEINKRWKLILLPSVERFALKADVQIKNVTLKDLFMAASKLLPVFKLPEKNRVQKNILDLQYIRVPKYGQSINLVDFMKSKIHFGISLIDIIEELKAYGLDETTVREYYEQILQELELPVAKTKKSFKNLGLLMHITPISAGFNIYIDNAISEQEIEQALYWTRATIYKASIGSPKRSSAEQRPPSLPEEEEEEEKVIIPEIEPRRKSSSRSSSELSLGGAIGKKYQRYFKNMLEKADPDLFAKSDNYARKCQISDLRQPVGITKEQKAKIDELGYSDGYDNSLEYGSDPNRPSVYMCPKIWCPSSQIPLSYEKYKALGEKCPDPTDDPILLYTTSSWYNDPLRKHYVGFLKERGYNNLRLPCCFKTHKETEAEERPRSIEDSYIIDKVKQIEPGRFGTIPSGLHEFLYPKVPYTLCKNTVKAEQCLLRKGIASGSLMEAIAYLLDFKSVEEIIATIYQKLDPLTFLTLENGKVYEFFLPTNIPKITNELKVWFNKFPHYVATFQLQPLLEFIDKPKEAPLQLQYQLARQALIRESYYNFLAYLKSPEANSPYLLFDLIMHLGAFLIVWNRDTQNVATMKCPFSVKNKWSHGLPYVLIMQQEDYYEPLVLVDRDKNITQKISFTTFEQLSSFLQKCPVMIHQEDAMIYNIKSLSIWIKYVLANPADLQLKQLVLNPFNQLEGAFCPNNIYIRFPTPISLFSLKTVLAETEIDTIIYQEDIQGVTYDITVSTDDLRLLQTKLKKLGFGLDLGTLTEDSGDALSSIYTVPTIKYPQPPKLPLILKDTFIRRSDLIENDNAKWYKVKKTILAKLLKEYDTLVKPLLKTPLLKQLHTLQTVFDYIQEPAKVAVLLEELPYKDKELLTKTYDQLLLEKPYYHKDDKIYEQLRSWIFTQKAIEKGLIDTIIKPTNVKRPKIATETITQSKLPSALETPTFLTLSKLDLHPLPTKWRSKFWSDFQVGTVKQYTPTTLLELFEWFSNKQGFQFDQSDLILFLRKQVYDMLADPSEYDLLVEDPGMRKAWMVALGKTYRSPNELIVAMKAKPVDELQQLWIKMEKPQWTNDLDLTYISELLSISFLVLQKGKELAIARGNVDELVYASKFISRVKNWEDHPVSVLFKASETDYSVYSILVNNTQHTFYEKGLWIPEPIKVLIHKRV